MSTTQIPAPSGDEYLISHGDKRVSISEVGASLRSFTVGDRDVIDGFAVNDRATDGRGQILAPWPNRLSTGRYTYDKVVCQAPINETGRNNAIHGLVRWLDWTTVAHDTSTLLMSCMLRPQPGYEWQLHLEVQYALDDVGLTVAFEATNVESRSAPWGLGFHPYLTLGTSSIDELSLVIPADSYLDVSDPQGPVLVPVSGTPFDYTRTRAIEAAQLDTAFGNLIFDSDGTAVARLQDAKVGRTVSLWVDEGYRYLMVYTGDSVDVVGRRRKAIAVEPMTCPPDAFRTGVDLLTLEPGESWRASWGIRPPTSA